MSDPVLTVCPECGQSTYAKQVTAAGFQLKGSGWYVTDFRDGGKKTGASSESAASSSSSPSSSSSEQATAAKPADTSSSTAAAS